MSRGGTACDTSLLVPALVGWHAAHEESRDALAREVTHLPAHVVLECYSVLTRMPAPHRVTPADAARALAALDLRPVMLPAAQHSRLVTTLAARGELAHRLDVARFLGPREREKFADQLSAALARVRMAPAG